MTAYIVKATSADGLSGEVFEVDAVDEDAARAAYVAWAEREYAAPFMGPTRLPDGSNTPALGGAFPIITVTRMD